MEEAFFKLLQENSVLLYITVFFIEFLETLTIFGLFVPGVVVLFVLGLLAPLGLYNIWYVFAAAVFGTFISDFVGYWQGYNNKAPLRKSFLMQKTSYIHQTERFFKRYKEQSIFLARFVGPYRCLIAWTAGRKKLSFSEFLFYNFFGSIFWVSFILALGYFISSSFSIVRDEVDQFGLLVTFVLIITALLYYRRRWVRRLSKFIE